MSDEAVNKNLPEPPAPSPGRQQVVVAIDGPAGAGKSTVSRSVARRLGYILLDTGALYRCVGLASRAVIDEPAKVTETARAMVDREAIRFSIDGERQRVWLDRVDVSERIRTQEVSTLASQVSSIRGVREALLEMQRGFGRQGGVVLEGRDIGTVVFPDAEAKFFLTASIQERARRRYDEVKEKEPEITQERIEQEVRERDQRDTSRPIAPLMQAHDAELVDTTSRTAIEIVDYIVGRVRQLESQLLRPSNPELTV